ncbi:hypothetical protein HanRHA438_Chr04g0178631 [Helianthus annuus]|nr:hypothetical protein HanRHA438_Chr04g0178631 [Helianthus annuus]
MKASLFIIFFYELSPSLLHSSCMANFIKASWFLFISLVIFNFLITFTMTTSLPTVASTMDVHPQTMTTDHSQPKTTTTHRSESSTTKSTREFEVGEHEVPSGPNPISNR